ncbi:MAG TPA: TrmH family RNA methyltransferase [Thermoplasmata archaeon]|nr:TrmH family RNA methyltransferase [Thermoplasmata archaeon]
MDGPSALRGGRGGLTARLRVVLVRPKEDGNVGAVARLARNFGADEIVLVAARARIGAVARRRAMGGLALLTAAKRVRSFDEAVDDADFVVGTTDLVNGRSRAYLRHSVPPEKLGELVRLTAGTVAVAFGPEDNGLGREELARCDLLVHVPARREFPTLNLSHAAGVVLYAIHRGQGGDHPQSTPQPETVLLDGREKELLLERIGALARRTGYPAHKRKGLLLLFRRLLGRATPSEAELRMLLGFLKGLERRAAERDD